MKVCKYCNSSSIDADGFCTACHRYVGAGKEVADKCMYCWGIIGPDRRCTSCGRYKKEGALDKTDDILGFALNGYVMEDARLAYANCTNVSNLMIIGRASDAVVELGRQPGFEIKELAYDTAVSSSPDHETVIVASKRDIVARERLSIYTARPDESSCMRSVKLSNIIVFGGITFHRMVCDKLNFSSVDFSNLEIMRCFVYKCNIHVLDLSNHKFSKVREIDTIASDSNIGVLRLNNFEVDHVIETRTCATLFNGTVHIRKLVMTKLDLRNILPYGWGLSNYPEYIDLSANSLESLNVLLHLALLMSGNSNIVPPKVGRIDHIDDEEVENAISSFRDYKREDSSFEWYDLVHFYLFGDTEELEVDHDIEVPVELIDELLANIVYRRSRALETYERALLLQYKGKVHDVTSNEFRAALCKENKFITCHWDSRAYRASLLKNHK